MEEFAIDGSFKVNPITKEFEINFDLPSSGLNIKGLSKAFLTSKISEIPNENGIYILEGNNESYIGQSKDLKKRLKNHQDTNKVSFTRCFMLSHIKDIRQYLDYMEAYAIKEIIIQGYKLDNKNKLEPDHDKLPSARKAVAKKWVDEFLLFLPVLGFRKSHIVKTHEIKETIENNVDSEFLNYSFSMTRDKYIVKANGVFNKNTKSLTVLKNSTGFFAKEKYMQVLQYQQKLLSQEIIKVDEKNQAAFIFLQDYEFKACSGAARIIMGKPSNGWVHWKNDRDELLDYLRNK